ncbi:hypothetical protein Ssi03_62910 [Sphaerisporangium siamense]|uniref:C2H2-type domain-containing protein n=1 Tax=Sphaerisporangium siamense TaxID=795645 RepID=A0A7W7D970_9ACTN|nr:hypothetical protein [Sphaerisporangium siamense]MBB4702599.1 hypothetical protein [Sphaerisporangium siamense]GII88301.1 hypothetical protein Ssi03_62910 [Sphaerisporangium siamense]
MPQIRGIRAVRVRWSADTPPKPLGCRWCGHPPYSHDATSLPHRRAHQWEQPTPAQMRARMASRRRLGLCASFPSAPARPVAVHPPAGRLLDTSGRPVDVVAHGRGRAPDIPTTGSRRLSHRHGAAA